MSKILFTGPLLIQINELGIITENHMNYVRGWLSNYLNEHPGHKDYIVVVKPLDLTSVEILVFDPSSIVTAHYENEIVNTLKNRNVRNGEGGDNEPFDTGKGGMFEPPVGRA